MRAQRIIWIMVRKLAGRKLYFFIAQCRSSLSSLLFYHKLLDLIVKFVNLIIRIISLRPLRALVVLLIVVVALVVLLIVL